ncbi:MAG: S8 family peptidase, partial [Actinomycetota bacterium]|nr:S8 family peptidase [Actinomycetota bacterium]
MNVSTRRPRRRRLALALTATGSLLLAPGALPAAAHTPAEGLSQAPAQVSRDGRAAPPVAAKLDPGLRTAGQGQVDVVVTGSPGRGAAVAAVVRAAGGAVTAPLPVVDGVRARVPADRLDDVAAAPVVRAVTANRSGRFQQLIYSDATTSSSFARSTGATTLWAQGSTTGRGVGVAVLDTGVSPMRDLAGRLVHGPDLSGEGTVVDTYGHGTVMAGIVGGSGQDSADSPGGARTGVAPEATVVSVKVAGRNGATDVSTVLQGMHWVAAYRDQFDIRVLNLSWGTASTQSPGLDPLNYAVERLWRLGIVVVTAAGNSGPGTGTILKPADDPLVITVGAYDDKSDTDPANDVVPAWSSRGPTAAGLAKPDVVAPGRTLVATRSFGSRVEAENPRSLVAPSYITGSGTSQAAAVTSGGVALLLQQRPGLTPDQVKGVLTGTAAPIEGMTADDQGAGRIALDRAAAASPGLLVQQHGVATGLGSLESSRGRHVEVDCGEDGLVDVVQGERDTRCEAWDGAAWTGAAWTGAAWTGAAWTGAAWTGAAWTG